MANTALETIKERIDIVDLIGARVRLRNTGRTFKGLCPFHEEKTPSFVVYPESQSYHCFGCGKSGDAFTFTMETENLDFRDALKLLADRTGVQLEPQQQERKDPERDRIRDRLIEINERAAAYFTNLLWTSPAAQQARDILTRRGVDRETANQFGLGFSPDSFDALKSHLSQRDISEDELLAAGVLSRNEESGRIYDRFRNRIMFPIRSRDGHALGFGARALGDEKPKYLNSPQTPIFDKRSVLYALDKAYDTVRRERSIVIVEGYMDAIAAHQHGYRNVVASMGTALTPQQVSSIRRYIDRVFLALDSDAAGQLATIRGIDAMRDSFADDARPEVRPGMMVRFERTLGAEIRVVVLPHGKDPDELIRADTTAWPKALDDAVPLAEYYLTQMLSRVDQSPNARAKALHEIAVPILKEIGDVTVLSHYVGLTARLLQIKDTDVHAAVIRRPSQRLTRDQLQPLSFDRPIARDPEDYLVAVILRYPQAGVAQLANLQRTSIIDGRHREILDALVATNGDLDAALAAMPPELAEYAQSIIAETEPRDGTIPMVSSREIPQAIRRLAQARYEEHMRHLQAALQQARTANDSESITEVIRQMSDLAQDKVGFAPEQSPYFRDLRSEGSISR